MNLDTVLTSVTKINSKQITGLNVKHKTIKLLEDGMRENIGHLGHGGDFSFCSGFCHTLK